MIRSLSLLLFLAACSGPPDGIVPLSGFDVQRYQGDWYEIMRLDHRFERGLSHVTARYTLRDDGSVGVLNRGLDAAECRWSEADGRATFQDGPDVASLSVTFFWPFRGGYHVIALDPDYRWAMVAGPDRGYLWILSRTPELPADIRDNLVAQARSLGFPVDELIMVPQGEPPCTPLPEPQ